ncbi:MAG: acyltransferase [Pseudomonadota bacterium]
MKLSSYTQGRNNNFNLIRIVAAYAVLVTHGFALAVGTAGVEPFRDALGMTMGTIAVDVFFLTSGFLVTASLLTRKSTIEFIWARVLRIFPALFVMLLLTVLGLGAFFTSVAWPTYLSDPQTHRYFLKCLTLIGGVEFRLPGVFESNPYAHTVNGSLWTMPYELRMYAILALMWLVLRAVPHARAQLFKIAIVAGTLLAGILLAQEHIGAAGEGSKLLRLAFMFFTGASYYILKERISLSTPLFSIALAGLAASLADEQMFFLVYLATVPYLLFFVAYVPSGFIRGYNRLGDYSYGLYIYAFPVQQSIAALLPGISVPSLIAISTLATFALAVLSWHLLERHALRLKDLHVEGTRKMLAALGLTSTSGRTR